MPSVQLTHTGAHEGSRGGVQPRRGRTRGLQGWVLSGRASSSPSRPLRRPLSLELAAIQLPAASQGGHGVGDGRSASLAPLRFVQTLR